MLFFVVLALFLGGAFASLALGDKEKALTVASLAAGAGSVAGFGFALHSFVSGLESVVALPIPLPLGQCLLRIDPLSSLFLLPVFFLAALASVLLPARIRALEGQFNGAAKPENRVAYGRHGFFFCLLIASMALVLTASDAVFFLIAWELMSLMPFFLISPQDKDSKERYAVWIYLVAAHVGALPLLLLFAGMTLEAGGTDFVVLAAHSLDGAGWSAAGLFFVLGLIGFGVKAGLAPLHMWMPEAHASAPGHVAVLLSGTMLNLGLYGILRLLSLLGPADIWWAYLLMGVGGFSGILGIAIGLAQSDIKRTLAYSSAENMGIICLALGAGLLASLHDAEAAAALFFAGALLHIWNHSLFKSLLFLGANAVKESIHTTSIRLMGGLQKRIPVTGGCMGVASAAIAGIPPLNGFMSEMLIYMGFAVGSDSLRQSWTSLSFCAGFLVLAVISGLALFAFSRMYGLAFLGLPRSEESRLAKEPEPLLRRIMIGMACLCLLTSLGGPLLLQFLAPFLAWFGQALTLPVDLGGGAPAAGEAALSWYSLAALLLLCLLGLAYCVRKRVVLGNGYESGLTWDCGYRYPSARMQYSGGSFAHSLALMLRPLTGTKVSVPIIKGLFPAEPAATMETPDWPTRLWGLALFRPVAQFAEWAKELQHGYVNVYILYMLIALMTALVWALGWS